MLGGFAQGPSRRGSGDSPFTQTLSWRGGSGRSMEMGREGVGTGGQGPRGERPLSWPGRCGEVGSSPGFEEAQVETECRGEFTVELSIPPGPAPARPRLPRQGGAAAGRLESQLPGQPAHVGYSPRPQGTGFTGLSPAPPLTLPRPLTSASLAAQR